LAFILLRKKGKIPLINGGGLAGSATQQHDEEGEACLESKTTSKIREKTDHCGALSADKHPLSNISGNF
jgi:hypothetical protein